MLRLREVNKEAIEQFSKEADWVIARRRKADEAARETAAEEKKKWLERLRRDEVALLAQKGKGRSRGDAGQSGMRLLLPELQTEAGPSVQAGEGLGPSGSVGGGFTAPLPDLSKEGAKPVDPAMQSLMQNISQVRVEIRELLSL